jgi:uncharacterized protein (DUF362 family)
MGKLVFNRRAFLKRSLVVAAGTPLASRFPGLESLAAEPSLPTSHHSDAKVAIVACRSYGTEVRSALAKSFDLLGGVASLVKNKTVTVKINLTGTDFTPFLNRPVGETYMTHPATALALGSLLFDAGAKRVHFVESTQSRAQLAASLALADWDIKAFEALGNVGFENTRNLGLGKSYAHLPVPSGGYMFSSFEFNHAYADTDVMVSLAKLKGHLTAGVTLSMKNLFGITPNSLYGNDSGSEDATEGRLPLHESRNAGKMQLPGLKHGIASSDPGWRVPRITADVCAARPIHLSIIDGITAMSGGEGPWCGDASVLKATSPGVLIVGLNPVSADAVGTAVMGYSDARALRGTKPFHDCDSHLLLAEKAGLGVADLSQIEVLGMTLEKARYPYS